MPHSEQDTMSAPMVNGEKPQSRTVDHVTSYPLVSDLISYYKSNPYGQKSLDLTDAVYARFGKPYLPYLQGPYSYIAPYVHKADQLGDDGLSKFDGYVPILKEDTEKVKGRIGDAAHYPFTLYGKGRQYFFDSWDYESKRIGGDGLPRLVKVAISTELKIGRDAFEVVQSYLYVAKDKAENKKAEMTNNS